MIDFIQWKDRRETTSSEKEPSFGSPNDSSAKNAKSGREKHGERMARPGMHLSAAALFADRYPDYFADLNNTRSRTEFRTVFIILSLITISVISVWILWQEQYFHTDGDFVYYMGLTGGLLMLAATTYSLRKRIKLFNKLGRVSTWYYAHLLGGVVGPILIILHSSFTLKAMNSTVALISMLCIVASGIFGRYIYTRIGYHLHRQLIAIRTTEERLAESMHKYKGEEIDAVEKALSMLTASAISSPKTLFRAPARFFALRAKAARCYIQGARQITILLKNRARHEKWDKHYFHAELVREKKFLREHVNALVKIGQSHFYERLLVGWRIFHVPLIFILVISGSVHVLAVHLY